jgi:1-deoxy-D-xylulose-5-phosphate reductoisomerase
MSKRVFIVGSTGSIGCSAIEVITHLRVRDGVDSWPVIGLTAGMNSQLLKKQAAALCVEAVSIHADVSIGTSFQYSSAEELIRKHAKSGDLVIAAIVGFAGVAPVLAAIECGCDIALANKETLVAAGEIVMRAVKEAGVNLLPVDSEHSAIFQSLVGSPSKEVKKIVLTASGGSLRGMSQAEVACATVEQVLDHPTWNMGAKVTVDSASLMNKALELIEAHWLFDVGASQLDAIIHPQSIVHGMVEFCDGSVIAQLSPPDMRLPIQYALTWPERVAGITSAIDWATVKSLEFEQIDRTVFPAISLAYEVIERGGTSGAILNASNEVVVDAFLQDGLPFGAMVAIVKEVIGTLQIVDSPDLESVLVADKEARTMAKQLVTS